MLNVYDLNGFFDKLDDLTRAADPMEIVVEATGLLDDNPARRFLMQRRAAAAADAHYLHGVAMRQIALACLSKATGRAMTTQTVRNWLDEYGPKHFLSMELKKAPGGEFDSSAGLVFGLIAMEHDDQMMKRKLRQQKAAGRRIVPASLNLVDLSQPDGAADRKFWPMTPEELWDHLGD